MNYCFNSTAYSWSPNVFFLYAPPGECIAENYGREVFERGGKACGMAGQTASRIRLHQTESESGQKKAGRSQL
jgi:hypothetical protein